MSTEERVGSVTIEAAGDLSSSQYLGVARDGNGQAAVATTLGQAGTGILQNEPAAQGRAATVATSGIAKCKAGATFSAGDKLTVMANGRFQLAAATHHVWGEAQEDGVDGQIVGIDLDSVASNEIL